MIARMLFMTRWSSAISTAKAFTIANVLVMIAAVDAPNPEAEVPVCEASVAPNVVTCTPDDVALWELGVPPKNAMASLDAFPHCDPSGAL